MKWLLIICIPLWGCASMKDVPEGEIMDATLSKIDTIYRSDVGYRLLCTWKITPTRETVVTFEDIPFYYVKGTHVPYLKVKQ